MVASPAVPPYSSTTIARCWRRACISASNASTGLDSGTKYGGRITLVDALGDSTTGASKSRWALRP